jgi:nitroimidazol reductase NimA-like FMN-containing flavoprotein (pyridoxamine 5'-phosphate oxidase superfamily)
LKFQLLPLYNCNRKKIPTGGNGAKYGKEGRMRRKDKEITDHKAIESIISKARVCRLAMVDEAGPYIVPLCFGFRNNALYFHSAAEGKKLGLLRKNPRVCFELDCDTEVRTGERACDFSMRYRCVIGFGKVVFLEAPAAKREALDIIMNHYAEGAFDYPDASVNKITVFKVEIDTMTGKMSP